MWVGSHTNWTGVVGCASAIYATAKYKHPHKYVRSCNAFWRSEVIIFGALLSRSGDGKVCESGGLEWFVWI